MDAFLYFLCFFSSLLASGLGFFSLKHKANFRAGFYLAGAFMLGIMAVMIWGHMYFGTDDRPITIKIRNDVPGTNLRQKVPVEKNVRTPKMKPA